MAAYQVLLLNTDIPQIQAAQAGDTYVVPRDISFSAKALIGYTDYSGVGTNGLAVAGNVGIGTSSPGAKLDVAGAVQSGGNATYRGDAVIQQYGSSITSNGGLELKVDGGGSGYGARIQSTFNGVSAYNLSFQLRNNSASWTQYMLLSSDGTFRVKGAGTAGSTDAVQFSGSAPASALALDSSGNLSLATNGASFQWTNSGNNVAINATSGVLSFYTGTSSYAERARITSGGYFLVGQTSNGLSNINGISLEPGDAQGGAYQIINHKSGTSSGQQYVFFAYNGSKIGDITQNGTTAVAYNTTSDYRLKENVEPMQNALATVAQLKPVTYTWKANGSAGQGFIAHELQAIVPDCVTGEKDAVDAEGNPKYQGVDTSFLVATLTAAIQEQQAMIKTLEAKIAALEQGA